MTILWLGEGKLLSMLHHAGHIPSLFPNPLDLHVLAISQHKDTLGEKKNPESSNCDMWY